MQLKRLLLAITLIFLCAACQKNPVMSKKTLDPNVTYSKAIFAGGCFWCIEAAFEYLDGVADAISGYIGGEEPNPSYDEVSAGNTGHYEAVEVIFDPNKISYEALVEHFWHQIDPTDSIGQFADKGEQYMTAIFYLNNEQKQIAEKSKEALAKSGKFSKPIATKILAATTFYRAEEYHQNYFEKNPIHYNLYKKGSGRAGFIEKNWAK